MKINKPERIVIDIETSGLHFDKHEIIEICIATLDDNFDIIDIWTTRVQFNVQRSDSIALKINGYKTDCELWNNAITQQQLAIELRNRIKGKTIVGHNPQFDMAFIKECFRLQGMSCPKYDHRLIDTIVLAHYHFDCLGMSLSLDSLRKFFGWSVDGSHTATKDVTDTAKLYKMLMNANNKTKIKWVIFYLLRSII